MIRRIIGEDVDLVTIKAKDLGNVKADPGQVEQVIMNLVVNARDAMPRGGTLTIETANTELSKDFVQVHTGASPGPFVMLAISDTGVGMDAEMRSHVFEPFFTTKEVGKGTGLGLSMVYGIVKQSDGYIDVESEPGRGTMFRIYLPRVEEEAEVSPAAPHGGAGAYEGRETILLAEDDPTVREFSARVLRDLGYTVLDAGDGKEAILISSKYAGRIHLLVTDVVMPGMSGGDLASRVASIRPGTKVLFISGYTDDTVVRHGVLESEIAFLQKPFAPEALARKVKEVLAA
jgi:CheY-like chemotaxis protein